MPDKEDEITLSVIYESIKKCEQNLYERIENSNAQLIQSMGNVERKIKESDKKVQELEVENLLLKERNEALERRQRRNNIVVYGMSQVEYTESNLPEVIVAKLQSLLGIDLKLEQVNNVFALGRNSNKDIKPILVEFISYFQKEQILRNIFKLKGKRVFITHDLTVQERKENKILRGHLKLARDRNLNAYIKGRKLFVNGESYSAKGLPGLEEVDGSTGEQQEQAKPGSAPSTPTTPVVVDFKEPISTRSRQAGVQSSSSLVGREKAKERQNTVGGGTSLESEKLTTATRSRLNSKSERKK